MSACRDAEEDLAKSVECAAGGDCNDVNTSTYATFDHYIVVSLSS